MKFLERRGGTVAALGGCAHGTVLRSGFLARVTARRVAELQGRGPWRCWRRRVQGREERESRLGEREEGGAGEEQGAAERCGSRVGCGASSLDGRRKVNSGIVRTDYIGAVGAWGCSNERGPPVMEHGRVERGERSGLGLLAEWPYVFYLLISLLNICVYILIYIYIIIVQNSKIMLT